MSRQRKAVTSNFALPPLFGPRGAKVVVLSATARDQGRADQLVVEGAMQVATINRINRAVKDCLAFCYGSDKPLTRLAQYVQRLHSDPCWKDREITYVELTVLRLLRLIA